VGISACALIIIATGTPAQLPEARKLTFDDAIQLSEAHPTHRGLSAALKVRKAQDKHISVRSSDPTIGVTPAMRLSPDQSQGVEVGIRLSQSWNLGGLGSRRQEAASRERDVLAAGVRADALLRRIEAARAWIELRVQEEDQSRVARELEVAQALAAKLETAASAGAVLGAELAEARAYTAQVREGQLDAEGGRVHAELDLAAALGLSPPNVLATEGAWPEPTLPPESQWPQLVKQATRLPRAQRAKLAQIAAMAKLQEAEAAGAWRLGTSVGLQKESPKSYIASIGLQVTLPVFSAARRERSQAMAAIAGAKAKLEATDQSVGRALAFALHEVEHERERLEVLQTELLPALKQLVKLRTASFERGEGTILEMFRAKQRMLEAEHQLNQVEGETHWVEVKAWLLLAAMQGPAGAEGVSK
jgi:outer membrane protein TolC